ncbi:MAG: AAA family ATPase [Pseudomonadota bacterium]
MSLAEDLKGASSPSDSASECIAFIGDSDTEAVVKTVLKESFDKPIIHRGSTTQVMDYLSEASAPGVLIVDVSENETPLTSMMSLTAALSDQTKVIGIGSVNDITLYREIVDSGATDYVVKPVTEKAMAAAIQRTREPAPTQSSDPEEKKHLRVAVLGARGGVGASTIASNLSWYFGEDQKQKTVLVDLDLEFGTIALSMDLEPTRGLREALENPARIDSLFISSATAKLTDHVSVMATEETLNDDIHFNPSAVDILFDTLARTVDTIVVDVPRSNYSVRQRALEAATHIVLITELSLPSLRDSIRILSSIDDVAAGTPVIVVANRTGGAHQAMPASEFQKALGRKVDFQVPEEAKALNKAANIGKPLVQSDKRCKASKIIQSVGKQVGGDQGGKKKAKTGKPGLRGLLKRG